MLAVISRSVSFTGLLRSSSAASIFLTKPERTLPGPNSINEVQPRFFASSMSAAQLVVPVTCSSMSALIAPGSEEWGFAVTLERTGNFGAENAIFSRTEASFSRAGAMNGEWKAPAVANGMARLMPSSLAIVAAAAKTHSACKMGIISATSVFWTVFICLLSGLVIVLAGNWQDPNAFAANLCNSAFKTVPYLGTPVLIFSLIIFSFTTLIGWSYYGEKALQFLGGGKWSMAWRIFYILVCVLGGGLGTAFSLGWHIAPDAFEVGLSTRFAWGLAVLMMTLMTLPNVYMLWRLRHKLQSETKRYLHHLMK